MCYEVGDVMTETTESFYATLPGFGDFSAFADAGGYQALPADWYVVITDVIGSTQAIEQGRYKEVNALGAASIVALLNACEPFKVPFLFGGDGTTVCIPPSKKVAVESALVATRNMAEASFQLDLRVGMVPMQTIHAHGLQVLVGKHRSSATFEQAMFSGAGLAYAESLIKHKSADNPWLIHTAEVVAEADFEGFQCRWQAIPSPHEEVVAWVVRALEHPDSAKQDIYSSLFSVFTNIYGEAEHHHPVRAELMKLAHTFNELSTEIGVQTTQLNAIQRLSYAVCVKFRTYIGEWLMASDFKMASVWWGKYKANFITNTDHRKFDDALRMVVSGTVKQRDQFTAYLCSQYEKGYLVYGSHHSKSSLATCLVRDFSHDHIHFIDANDGGYALASKQLKMQLGTLK